MGHMQTGSTLFVLTHICLVDPSILINWTSPFPNLGVSDVLFHLYSILNRYSCQQTVKTLIRRRILRRLIWVCIVCLCPKNGTLGLYALKYNKYEKIHHTPYTKNGLVPFARIERKNVIRLSTY